MEKSVALKLFRQECRSCHFYQERVEKIDQKIELLDLRMQNVQSPKMEKIGQTPSRHELSYAKLITRKEKLLKDKAYYQELLDWVKDTIDAIPSLAYRSVVWATYVERKSLQLIAEENHVSKDTLYKKRKKFVSYVLTDERMQQLNELLSARPE